MRFNVLVLVGALWKMMLLSKFVADTGDRNAASKAQSRFQPRANQNPRTVYGTFSPRISYLNPRKVRIVFDKASSALLVDVMKEKALKKAVTNDHSTPLNFNKLRDGSISSG
ncbi:hypothetical protein BKA70DRAFT_749588 [Coprinopsis sp. MPI-PUGE-AT-0042]|nr:hypothetical protein BKA70DRAFT_749588 [Coprinopsis sp. MPI-PUGE-AT-0042]